MTKFNFALLTCLLFALPACSPPSPAPASPPVEAEAGPAASVKNAVMVLHCGKLVALVVVSTSGDVEVVDASSGLQPQAVLEIARQLDAEGKLKVIHSSCDIQPGVTIGGMI